METHLAEWLRDTPDGLEAESILRKCVHCGFCTATCPTYQLLGDELDGPRGRIYLIKQVVEGHEPTVATLTHLDRCLTCRNCETTCPSGVDYGHLVDVGRRIVENKVERPIGQRLLRGALREGLTRRWLFDSAMTVGKALRPMLPEKLRDKLPVSRAAGAWPSTAHARKVLLLNGCVQPAMMPNIDAATARVLDRLGVQAIVERKSGCCGAIRHHLNDSEGALANIRRNIDAWWPHFSSPSGTAPASVVPAGGGIGGGPAADAAGGAAAAGVEAIVINASGCGAMVKEYGHLLRDDPVYAERAARISALTVDLAEWLPAFEPVIRDMLARQATAAADAARIADAESGLTSGAMTSAEQSAASTAGFSATGSVRTTPQRVAFHPPCTLQHGQQVRGEVEKMLVSLGVTLTPVADSHLCCGSAGTYSITQPELSRQLRDRKVSTLQQGKPDLILSANIGCLAHLQSGTAVPVRHWIEWLDDRMAWV